MKSLKKIKNYSLNADVIRVLATFGVIVIHTANSIYERPDFFGGISWWFSIILNAVSRISVPLFIMLSGYFLLRKDRHFPEVLTRITERLLLPLFFWTTFTYITADPKNYSDIFHLNYYLRFFSGNVFYYYFLVILTGLYFISPLLRSFIKTEKLKTQKKMAICFVLVGVAETAVEFMSKTCALENAFTKWVPFTGLFVVGYLITKGAFKEIKIKTAQLFFVLGLITTVVLDYLYFSEGSLTVLRTNYPGCLSQYSDYYLSFNVTAMTISAFVILISMNMNFIKGRFLKKIIYDISRLSFGIYLVHLTVVTFWDKVLGWDADHAYFPLWLYLIFRIFGIFAISYIVASILSRNKFTRRLIGGY